MVGVVVGAVVIGPVVVVLVADVVLPSRRSMAQSAVPKKFICSYKPFRVSLIESSMKAAHCVSFHTMMLELESASIKVYTC